MIALKAIQTSFTAKRCTSFHTTRLSNNKKNSTLCLCKSVDSDSGDSSPEGDTRKQELLARIAQLQTQKVRLTDYLDEKSAYLTQFAEEANAEFDKIGEDALKELDEAEDRIMENIKSRMQAFEESCVDCCVSHCNCRLFHLFFVGLAESCSSWGDFCGFDFSGHLKQVGSLDSGGVTASAAPNN